MKEIESVFGTLTKMRLKTLNDYKKTSPHASSSFLRNSFSPMNALPMNQKQKNTKNENVQIYFFILLK